MNKLISSIVVIVSSALFVFPTYGGTDIESEEYIMKKCVSKLKNKFLKSSGKLEYCNVASNCYGASSSDCQVYDGVAIFFNYKGTSNAGGDYIINGNFKKRLSPETTFLGCKKKDGSYSDDLMDLSCKNIINKSSSTINNCDGVITLNYCN